jgi:hypothetical protein
VLRSVSTTIGMPAKRSCRRRQDREDGEGEKQQQQGGGNIDQLIQQAVNKGVEAGVKRISTELAAGVLAQHAHMPEGNPTHIGTPGSAPGGGQQGASSGPGMDAGQGGGMHEAARKPRACSPPARTWAARRRISSAPASPRWASPAGARDDHQHAEARARARGPDRPDRHRQGCPNFVHIYRTDRDLRGVGPDQRRAASGGPTGTFEEIYNSGTGATGKFKTVIIPGFTGPA